MKKELIDHIKKRNSNSLIDSYNTNIRLFLYKSRQKIVMDYMWLYTLLDMGNRRLIGDKNEQ